MRGKVPRWTLYGCAAGVIITLAALPSSRWIVAQQISFVFGRSEALTALTGTATERADTGISPLLPESTTTALEATTTHRPDDVLAQLAVAVIATRGPQGTSANADIVKRLRALPPRFRARPEYWALILAHSRLASVEDRIQQERDLPPGRSQSDPNSEQRTADRDGASPSDLEDFEDAAFAGERIDPTNAIFPVAAAAGLFHARRDEQAIEALLRVGECTRFTDFWAELRPVIVGLLDDVNGDPSVFRQAADIDVVARTARLTPLSVASLAARGATEAERAGRVDRGRAIRRALVRLGDLMSADARDVRTAMSSASVIRAAAASGRHDAGNRSAIAAGRMGAVHERSRNERSRGRRSGGATGLRNRQEYPCALDERASLGRTRWSAELRTRRPLGVLHAVASGGCYGSYNRCGCGTR